MGIPSRFISPLVEPLEARIAPATILVGFSGVGDTDTEYAESPFSAIAGGIYEGALGASPNTFSLQLTKGDVVKLYNPSTGYQDLVKVSGGNAVVFFVDKDTNGEVGATEITGIALGKNAKISVFGSVYGDIVTNLNSDFTLNSTGIGNAKVGIKKLQVGGGSVFGDIIAGGTIGSLSVTNAVVGIYTGNAANGITYDFNDTVADGGETIIASTEAGRAGGSILNSVVGAVNIVRAGDGGAGAKGGSIKNFTLVSDADGFSFETGAGGAGATGLAKGGAGGGLSNIYIQGLDRSPLGDADIIPNEVARLEAGVGGDGFEGGKGGKGGGFKNIFVGFENVGGNARISDDFLRDDLSMIAGAGGNGGSNGAGGVGGGFTQVQVVMTTPDNLGVEDEISLIAGAGGIGAGAKSAGAGGGFSFVNVGNYAPSAVTADILLEGGAGGSSADGKGGTGGSLANVTATGFGYSGIAGMGGIGGSAGGAGGGIKKFVGSNEITNVVSSQVVLEAGAGAAGASGKGGKGGGVKNVTIFDADFSALRIEAGAGGAGVATKGGAGGTVNNVRITDSIPVNSAMGEFIAGDGGVGATKGGKGGALDGISITALGMGLTFNGGDGGDGGSGNGGAGGALNNLAGALFDTSAPVAESIVAKAGDGGASAASAVGGAGAGVKNVNFVAPALVSVIAGDGGGVGAGGAAGVGGSIIKLAAQSEKGVAYVEAGSAGLGGANKAAGGSVKKSNVLGDVSVYIYGGNGASGGAGGSISDTSWSGAGIADAPTSEVEIFAGAGSSNGTKTGAGGSIITVTGYVAETGGTTILAGDALGTGVKGATGGSIAGLDILGGGGAAAVVVIEAGDASAGTGTKKGAKGGSVSDVNWTGTVDGDTILRSIGAGRGGDSAGNVGGVGGSVSDIQIVGSEIGVMSGQTFGYTTMGGIFAGKGGGGTSDGRSGDVTNVTADAISTIIAGRDGDLGLVNLVDKVYLGGFNVPTLLIPDDPLLAGDYSDYGTFVGTNAVGGVANLAATPASQFKFTVALSMSGNELVGTFTDGLVAASNMSTKRNFIPGAFYDGVTLTDFNV